MALDSPTHCDDSGMSCSDKTVSSHTHAGNTPLHRAALLGHPQATLHLIKKGASAKAQNSIHYIRTATFFLRVPIYWYNTAALCITPCSCKYAAWAWM